MGSLTDAELARYAEIVADQAALEWQRRTAQIACAVAAMALAATSVYLLALGTGGARTGLGFGALGLGFGYWPYRKAKTRRLWKAHVTAIEQEVKRRDTAGA
ncbi:MAG: hypothetical protein AAFQ45_13915 [Pseudomonadota bacterium]